MSDQKVRSVSYSIVEAGGSIGYTDSVTWCVNGLDRLDAFKPPPARWPAPDMTRALAASVIAALLSFAPAFAASDCILDNCADRRPMTPQRSSNFGHGDRDFRRRRLRPARRQHPRPVRFLRLLAVVVAPVSARRAATRKGRDQCKTGSDVGFTVHGLWPQYDHGFPSDCRGSTRFPSRSALAKTDGVYPDEGLARYEWRKHGTCSGLSPNDYFAAAKQARDAITIPPQFKDPHQAQSLAPLDVERAFTEANTRLRPGMVAAICQNGTLDEVRFCFTKDLTNFQMCPEVVRTRCRSQSMSVPPVR